MKNEKGEFITKDFFSVFSDIKEARLWIVKNIKEWLLKRQVTF